MAHSREDLEEIRRTNRAALGLADAGSRVEAEARPMTPGDWTGPVVEGRVIRKGMADAVPGGGFFTTALSGLPPIGLELAFPPAEFTWDPSQPSAPASSEPGWGDWFTRHVARPVVKVGDARVPLYSPEDADYSDLFAVGAAVLAFGSALAGGWILYRAFVPRRIA